MTKRPVSPASLTPAPRRAPVSPAALSAPRRAPRQAPAPASSATRRAPASPAASSSPDPTFKMLYVLAIIMIVDGHVGSSDYLDFNGLLRYQNYHIALFMFVSGYFLNLTRGCKEFFARKTMRLIVPLFLWNAAYGALCWYLNRYRGFSLGGEFNLYNLLYAPLVDGHQFIYNMASWFLVPLFLVQAIGFLILRPFAAPAASLAAPRDAAPVFPSLKIPAASLTAPVSPSLKIPAVLFFALALALGCIALAYAPENHGARTPALTALRTLYFLPAFAFGFLYRHALQKYDTVSTPLYLFAVLAALTYLTGRFPGYNHVPSWLDAVNAPALAIYAISLLAILFWLRVARVLSPLLAKSRPLQYIADHTFDIMMHHFAGFMLAKALFLPFISAATSAAAASPLALHTAAADAASALARVKSDIWYYPFPESGETSAWLYIAISIVIALTAGFTTRKIYAIISQKLSHF